MFLMHGAHITYVPMCLDRCEGFRVGYIHTADAEAKRRFRRSAAARMSGEGRMHASSGVGRSARC
jgi:hypothetical protein